MIISKTISDELIGLQEDVAAQFCDDNFPIGGEIYWSLVESIATAKLLEIKLHSK